MIVYDQAKRQSNLVKHGLDLADAAIVYDSPRKMTLISPRCGERRFMDIAMVEFLGVILVLVYVQREDHVRAISMRRASQQERKRYAEFK